MINLLWKWGDKGTHLKFCWIPSHCGIVGNEDIGGLAQEPLEFYVDNFHGIHYADLKPHVNIYVQQLMQIK